MDQILATESLLPWLGPESSKIYLKVSAPGVDSSVSATTPGFPHVDIMVLGNKHSNLMNHAI